MDRYKISLAALASLLLLVSADSLHPLCGQIAPAAPGAEVPAADSDDQLTERVFLPPDRSIRQLLDRAEQLLAKERYSEAVQALHSVLNSPEDYFFRPQLATKQKTAGQTYRSLKSEARRLIGQLPAGGKRSYDLQFGATARRKLDQAVADGDMEAVAEVTRRYCHTEASQEALVLLGRYHLDQGRPLAAALCIEQVQRTAAAAVHEPGLSLFLAVCWARAGQPEKSAIVLNQIRTRWPDARTPTADHPNSVAIASRPVDRWVAEWIGETRVAGPPDEKEWTLFMGSATRTASAPGGRPLMLRPCWRQRVAVEAGVEETIASKARQMFDQSVPAIPALYPLAVGDVVIMRAAGRLAGVNIDSGKIVWQTGAAEDVRNRYPGDGEQAVVDPQEQVMRPASAPERVWTDKTIGTISSDGELVFAIEEPGTPVEGKGRFVIDPFGRRRNATTAEVANNILAAYEVQSSQGKQRWSVGGSGSVEPKLDQVQFLGPPLPLQGRLYVIAELAGEVRLLVLSAETGRLQWSQQLAVADDEIARDGYRYSAGISPSFADGVLVCPTTAGAIVAIDLTTRSLLWGYQYPRDAATDTSRDPFAPALARRSLNNYQEVNSAGWRDSCPMIDSGKVIVTPAESTQLHCLSLENGQVQWKLDRQEHLYAAAVHAGRVIVVGEKSVAAVSLSGANRGQIVSTIPLPPGTLPNGRGCYTGREYFLPLLTGTGAEIARIDLDQAKLVDRITCRDGSAPGNLICYRGRMFSQGSDWLQSYHQLDVLKRSVDATLADKPQDAGALALRAQILIEQGKPAEALPLLRRAYQTYSELAERPDKETPVQDKPRRREALAERLAVRELLVDGLLEHLTSHFDQRETIGSELTQLIDQPEERIRYLRIVAEGLAKAGDEAGALVSYFQLVDLAGSGAQPVSADPAHKVRLDRWLAARLGALAPKLPESLKAQYDRKLTAHLQGAKGDKTESVLRSHLIMFGNSPVSDEARLRLVKRSETPDNLLERARWLEQVANTGKDAPRREATARLALLLAEAERVDEAAVYYRRLRLEWPDVVCLAGRTGRQIYEDLPSRSPIRRREAASTTWPFGAIKATQGSAESRYPGLGYQPASELVTAGRQSSDPLRVFLDAQQQILSGHDSLGRARWRIPLARDVDGSPLVVHRYMAAGSFDGHLLIMSLGAHVVAVNTLKPGGPNGQGVLWTDEIGPLASTFVEDSVGNREVPDEHPRPWDDEDPTDDNERGVTLAHLGPIVAGGATYLRSRELVSVDPLTGKRWWSRRDVPPGSQLFGDDELLLAAPPQATEALVMQSVDGTLLGRRKVPPAADCFTTLGRNIVCVANEPGKGMRLRLFDPWMQKELWHVPLEAGTKATLVDATTAALLDRQGRLVFLNLKTGKPVFSQQLDSELRLSALHVIASRDCFIVIANRPRHGEPDSSAFLPAHENGGPMINGRVCALDRVTGRLLWPAAAEIENFALVLEQPVDLPLIVFARRRSEGQRTSFMFLDKRTGALATPTREFTRQITNFEIVGDDEKKTVSLHLRSMANVLTLSYTTDPAPPEPPIQGDVARLGKERGSGFGNTLRELGKAVKELQKPPADRAQQEKELFGE